jgi:hypothetical protein
MTETPRSCTPVKARTHFESVVVDAEAIGQRNVELRMTELFPDAASYSVGHLCNRRKKECRSSCIERFGAAAVR